MTERGAAVAVIGGGVTGLTAAFALRRMLGTAARLDLWEATDRLGGLLDTARVGPATLDVGAEAFIVRRPEAVDLIADLGLTGEVVSPGPLRPAIWSHEALHPLPAPAVMGIPARAQALGALVDDVDRARIAAEADRPLRWTPGAPVSVGELVGDRFGAAVVARSVDPMLGGVYSARADDVGLAETVPALAAALDAGAPSLSAAVASLTAAPVAGPVFGALRGGYRRLVDALAAAAAPRQRIGQSAVSVSGGPDGYTVVGADGQSMDYDGVIVAVPAPAAAPLLTESAPAVAAALAAVRPAGSAIVALALAPDAALPAYSGILVASDSDLSAKAVTLASAKWPHLAAGGPPTLRVSFGRLGEPVSADDDELAVRAARDLDMLFTAADLPMPEITATLVRRWPTGLPHYAPGHLAAMAAARSTLPAGLAVAGAAFGGVGVPACIASAREAADRVAGHVHGH